MHVAILRVRKFVPRMAILFVRALVDVMPMNRGNGFVRRLCIFLLMLLGGAATPHSYGDTAPASSLQRTLIVWIVDRSGSMGQSGNDLVGAVDEFLRDQLSTVKGETEVRIIFFSSHRGPERRWPSVDVGAKVDISRFIRGSFRPNGGTRLFDTVAEVMAETVAESVGFSHVTLAVFSDGADTSSRRKNWSEVERLTPQLIGGVSQGLLRFYALGPSPSEVSPKGFTIVRAETSDELLGQSPGDGLTVGAIRIVRSPRSRKIVRGSTVMLHVEAVCPLPLSYRWFHNGVPMRGMNGSVLTLERTNSTHEGVYETEVTNGRETARSSPAEILIVTPQTNEKPDQLGELDRAVSDQLQSKLNKLFFSYPYKLTINAMELVRPVAGVHAAIFYSAPDLSLAALSGGGSLAIAVTKEVALEILETVADPPNKQSLAIGNHLFIEGVKAYNANYSIYKKYSNGLKDPGGRETYMEMFLSKLSDDEKRTYLVNWVKISIMGFARKLIAETRGDEGDLTNEQKSAANVLASSAARVIGMSDELDALNILTRSAEIYMESRELLNGYPPYVRFRVELDKFSKSGYKDEGLHSVIFDRAIVELSIKSHVD